MNSTAVVPKRVVIVRGGVAGLKTMHVRDVDCGRQMVVGRMSVR